MPRGIAGEKSTAASFGERRKRETEKRRVDGETRRRKEERGTPKRAAKQERVAISGVRSRDGSGRIEGRRGGIIDADMCSSLGVASQPLTRQTYLYNNALYTPINHPARTDAVELLHCLYRTSDNTRLSRVCVRLCVCETVGEKEEED